MIAIDNLLLERDETQEACLEIVSILNEFTFSDSLRQKIVFLLYEKLYTLNNLSSLDMDLEKIKLKISVLDAEIYKCLRIARHELAYDNENMKKFVGKPIFQKYYVKDSVKRIRNFKKDGINFVKKYYLSLMMFVGAIPFILYFIVSKNISSFPVLDTLNIVSLFGTIAIVGAGLLFIIYLFPMLYILLIYSSQDIKQDYKYRFRKEIPVVSIIFNIFLLCYFLPDSYIPSGIKNVFINVRNFIENMFVSEIYTVYFCIAFIVLSIIRFIMTDVFTTFNISYKEILNNFKNRLNILIFIIFNEFFWFFMSALLLLILYVRIGDNSIFILLSIILSMIFGIVLISAKDFDYYKLSFYLLIFFNFVILFFSSDNIIKIANYGNIDYKFISLDKKALSALPSEICKKDCDKYFCLTKDDKNYCSKNISVISYIDNNLTIKYDDNNQTQSLYDISIKECFKFYDKSGEELNIKESKSVNFNDGTLKFIDSDDVEKEEQNATINSTPQTCMTYLDEENNVIKLYNIKALSTLGKFYYLQTKSGKKFEIDSSLIISKQKFENAH